MGRSGSLVVCVWRLTRSGAVNEHLNELCQILRHRVVRGLVDGVPVGVLRTHAHRAMLTTTVGESVEDAEVDILYIYPGKPRIFEDIK